jgi:hypothetical protein
MVDPTLAELMSDLVKYRPMLEQMYKRWLDGQPSDPEPTVDPPPQALELTATAKVTVPP